jgi:O-methyltransferase
LPHPWETEPFASLYAKIHGRTVVSADRCYMLYNYVKKTMSLSGKVAECGVFKGGTAYIIASAMKGHGKTLELFDTFSGMPSYTAEDPSWEVPGQFNAPIDEVRAFLVEFNRSEQNSLPHKTIIDYNIGDVQDTLVAKKWEKEQYCFVHLDVDLYISTLTCFQYFYPLLVTGGVIICDDYGFGGYEESAKRAVDEYMADKPESVILLPTKQSLVIRLED